MAGESTYSIRNHIFPKFVFQLLMKEIRPAPVDKYHIALPCYKGVSCILTSAWFCSWTVMLDYTFAKPHQHHTTESALSHLSHPPRSYAIIQHFSKASEIQCGSISVTVQIPKSGAVTIIYLFSQLMFLNKKVSFSPSQMWTFVFFIWHIPINDKKWLTWPVSLFLWRPLLEKKYQDLVPQQAGLDGGLDRLQNCANQMKNRRIQSSNKNSKQILKVFLF